MPTEFTYRDGDETVHVIGYKDEITGIDRAIAESRVMYEQIATDPALNAASQALAWWFAKIAFFSFFLTVPLCLTLWLRVLIPRSVIVFHMKRLLKVTGGWVVIWLFANLFSGPMFDDVSALIPFSQVMGIICIVTLGFGLIQRAISTRYVDRAAGNGIGWLGLLLKADPLRATIIQDAVIVGALVLVMILGGADGSDLLIGVVIVAAIFGYLWYYQRKFRDLLPETQFTSAEV